MPIQETSVEQLSGLAKLAPYWKRRIRFSFFTASERIDGYVRTSCYRLVDHLNQVAPNGVVRIEEFAVASAEIPEVASQPSDYADLDVANIYLAIPEAVQGPETRSSQVRTPKRVVPVIAGIGRWVVSGKVFLPEDAPLGDVPLEVLSRFTVLTEVTIQTEGDADAAEHQPVLIVNRDRLDYLRYAHVE